MENQLRLCQANCAEKVAEICKQKDEIEKLEITLKSAQEEISVKLNELEVKGSELATLDKNLQTANADIEEKKKTIEVRVIPQINSSPFQNKCYLMVSYIPLISNILFILSSTSNVTEVIFVPNCTNKMFINV